MQNQPRQHITTILLLCAAMLASLKLYCLSNPFYIPTIDDSAIVMRYLSNFQQHHFFSYNVEDGPVYGISCFWLGLAAGGLSWWGLDPQASLMTVALVSTFLFFFAALRICLFATNSAYVSIALSACVFYASLFIPKTMFLGLEAPLHLWLVTEMILAFLQKRGKLFYLLSAACVISKLDASFMVAFLGLMRLYDAYKEDALSKEVKTGLLYFGLPFAIWLAFATLVFGNPIPQSFLSKFFLRQKAPKTSWFPFLEPLIDSKPSLKSLSLMMVSMVLAIALKAFNKVSDRTSSTFAILFIGTMALYYIYNPGEKMPWYYPLPEFLALMSVVCLPVSVFTSKTLSPSFKLVLIIVSVSLLVAVTRIRRPMSRDAVTASRVWQEVFEKERMETGILANAVAPKERPVLWTGHGYPAYMFKGYIADYAGLNFRKIWAAVDQARNPSPDSVAFLKSLGLSDVEIENPKGVEYRSGLLLMKNHAPNVYMQHGLFPEPIQRARHMRLAGSFYTIDLVGAPAFRVFVEDAQWPNKTTLLPEADIKVSGEVTPPAANQLWRQGASFSVKLPAHATELLFGAERSKDAFELTITLADGQVQTCHIDAIHNRYGSAEVQSCTLRINEAGTDSAATIAPSQGVKSVKLYELAVTTPHTN